jgi:DNA-binding transcriptional MerR regulator
MKERTVSPTGRTAGHDGRTVGEVARLSGVSVRALHHYDAIGLVTPSGRTAAGYRVYSDEDLARLRRVLFYRALDFGLPEIAEMLADPGVTAEDHLRAQHRMLRQRLDRTGALLGAIEKEMEARTMGISLTPEEQFELFGTDPQQAAAYAAEVEDRWGDSEAWRQSQRRAAAYSREDWVTIKAEADAIEHGLAEALRAGAPATGDRAMDLAAEHRRHMGRWFFDCAPAMHRGMAELYVTDPRFTAHYEALAPGLTGYIHDAIVANSERATG